MSYNDTCDTNTASNRVLFILDVVKYKAKGMYEIK